LNTGLLTCREAFSPRAYIEFTSHNLVLARKRADIAKQDLIRMGIPAERIVSAVGWGKLYPTFDFDSDECWDSNRRAHLRYYW
jgi:outer membrane protein OmpA-like peptidoglycan-associated protein